MMEVDVRYLARIEELGSGNARARLLHRVINHSMDLQPLDSVITIAVSPEAYDDLVVLHASAQEAVVDVLDGRVVRAASVGEAGIRPAQRLVVEFRESLDIYGAIYVAAQYFEPLERKLSSMAYRWQHVIDGQKHTMTIQDAVQVDSGHCGECRQVRLLRSGLCRTCIAKGFASAHRVAYDLVGMLLLDDKGMKISDGIFTTQADQQGRVQIQCRDFTIMTNAYHLQGLLERAVRGGR